MKYLLLALALTTSAFALADAAPSKENGGIFGSLKKGLETLGDVTNQAWNNYLSFRSDVIENLKNQPFSEMFSNVRKAVSDKVDDETLKKTTEIVRKMVIAMGQITYKALRLKLIASLGPAAHLIPLVDLQMVIDTLTNENGFLEAWNKYLSIRSDVIEKLRNQPISEMFGTVRQAVSDSVDDDTLKKITEIVKNQVVKTGQVSYNTLRQNLINDFGPAANLIPAIDLQNIVDTLTTEPEFFEAWNKYLSIRSDVIQKLRNQPISEMFGTVRQAVSDSVDDDTLKKITEIVRDQAINTGQVNYNTLRQNLINNIGPLANLIPKVDLQNIVETLTSEG